MNLLIDKYNRKIDYIRVSITDRCDLKCIYCTPKDSGRHSRRRAILRFEEITRIVRCFANMGVHHVRITGGEPLMRKGLVSLIEQLSRIDGIDDLAMTTNATLLARYARDLKEAGLKRVNISLDTLKPEIFKIISGGGRLEDVLNGIRAAVNFGLTPINLNAVAMKGLNDNELIALVDFAIENNANMRFIECMPVGRLGNLGKERFISVKEIKSLIGNHFELIPSIPPLLKGGAKVIPPLLKGGEGGLVGGGPASYFHIKSAISNQQSAIKIGFISPITQHFCEYCNRVRLTAEGILRLCLGQKSEIDLRDYIRSGISDDALQEIIVKAVLNKPQGHQFSAYSQQGQVSTDEGIPIEKAMSMIGG
ncbi:MAG: GTP 3',8-cyclase MoaA [Nitrospinae bacterium]|nr:GTP 3',8-cyclase MoaA [Nitrospinota bacterium]